MNAIFFVLRTGCQWNALNATGLCTSSSAHRRFSEWHKAGVFERLFEEVLVEYDDHLGLDWRWLSCDGALTKAPLGQKTGRNPTDRGKLDTKRSSLGDARGVPLVFVVAGANRHDLPLLQATLEAIPTRLEAIPTRLEVRRQRLLRRAHKKGLTQTQNLCLDAGYEGAKAHILAVEFGLCPHIRSRGEEKELKQKGKRARRWVIEALHSWLNRYRALLIRWSKKSLHHGALLHRAAANLTLNRLLR